MDDLADLRATFLIEAREHLATLESGILRLQDGEADKTLLDEVFRAAHSIKGGAGVVQWPQVVSLVHVLENVLDAVRQGKKTLDPAAIAVLLDAAAGAGRLLDAAEAQDLAEPSWLPQMLENLRGTKPSGPSAKNQTANGSDWAILLRPKPDMLHGCNDPLMTLDVLAGLGKVNVRCDTSRLPPLAGLDATIVHVSWRVELRGGPPRDELDAALALAGDDCEIHVSPLKPAPAERPPRQITAKPPAADRGSIRVHTERIDAVLDQVGELVVSHAMLSERLKKIEDQPELREGIKQIEKRMRELQETVLSMRMLPVRTLFERMPRMVYDLSRELGKQVRLEVRGEWTEVDREVLQKLSDPLIHLVRNSLDHGLEPPVERVAAGKAPEGLVVLEAAHRGGTVVIAVRDDGRGLNPGKILAKAVERGLVPPGTELSTQQIADLIFEPGFSTASAVTDVSGRGVGMDVVRRNIEGLGGRVVVHSAVGQGSSFEIQLPLTLAILDGQLVRVGSETLVIPVRSIDACLKPAPGDFVEVPGQGRVVYHRGVPVRVVRLAEWLGFPGGEGGLVVVADAGGNRIAIEVDALGGHQQFVLKSLERNYRKVGGVAGAAISGDGRVLLVLDVTGLVDARAAAPPPSEARPSADDPARLLLVEAGGARCALDLGLVEAVRSPDPCTRLPFAGAATLGATNVRGEVIPLLDARPLLGQPEGETGRRVVVLIRVGPADRRRLVGLSVDQVLGIRDVPGDLQARDTGLIRGVYPDQNESLPLLDVDRASEAA